jgi:predicted nucleotidyltransferase
MIALLKAKLNEIEALCSRYGVARLEVFGSALREDFQADRGDLDMLVELKPMEPYARVEAYFGLLDALRTLLHQDIDLVMAGAVKNPYISQEIERTKQLLYAA